MTLKWNDINIDIYIEERYCVENKSGSPVRFQYPLWLTFRPRYPWHNLSRNIGNGGRKLV